ncbi:MAG: LamG-like jellyroll fold domain-containing protein, partial [Verrucomicrobiota bacterium]
GRWPGKTALDFRREGDRVRFVMPGEFPEMTLYVWVRIDALDRHLNSLFLTESFDENEVHWQVARTGHLHFATSPMGWDDLDDHARRFFSDNFWTPQQSGQWQFIGTTIDTASGEVKHYLNGDEIAIVDGDNRDKPLFPLQIGEADLGNWTDDIRAKHFRTLNGRIDEFGIYRAALSADEMRELYEGGKY